MRKVLFPILALVLALGLALPMATPAAADPISPILYAGQDIDVGTVSVWNDGTNLYVEYDPSAPWVVTESHLYVGKTDPGSDNFPSTPGQFPYSPGMEKSPSPGASYDASTLTYTIPLAQIYEYEFVGKGQGKGLNAVGTPGVVPPDEIYIAAHGDLLKDNAVTQEETAWADGDSFGKNWAMYFTYTVQGENGNGEPPPGGG